MYRTQLGPGLESRFLKFEQIFEAAVAAGLDISVSAYESPLTVLFVGGSLLTGEGSEQDALAACPEAIRGPGAGYDPLRIACMRVRDSASLLFRFAPLGARKRILRELAATFPRRLTATGKVEIDCLLAGAARDKGVAFGLHDDGRESPVAVDAEHMLATLMGTPSGEIPELGVACTHIPAGTTREVPRLLGFREGLFNPGRQQAACADVFYSWGIRTSYFRARLRWLARAFNRPWFVVEDGLILRSIGLGVGEDVVHALSVTLDRRTAYYDATQPSELEERLNSELELTGVQRSRSNAAIAEIRERRLSKYNHAPDSRRSFGPAGRPNVLLIDQRRNDASVRYGLASEKSFDAMIRHAIAHYPRHTLLLKRHPDAISGGTGSYFSDRRLKRLPIPWDRTVLIDQEVNPHTLFDQVERVLVVTSGFGFEALMAGLPVECFGAPFYAGWGLTKDHLPVPRRQRGRDLASIFHVANIDLARYFAPDLSGQVTLENAIDNFTQMTGFTR